MPNENIALCEKPVTQIKGVGKTRATQLNRLGIYTIKDLAYYFPRAYENRGNVKKLKDVSFEIPVSVVLTVGTVVKTAKIRNGLTISKFRAFDESGAVEIVFFNSPFVKDVFTVGADFRFFGKFSLSKKQLQLLNPKYEPCAPGVPLPDFIPVYPLTEGLSSKNVSKMIETVIDDVASSIFDYLPDSVRVDNSLPTLSYALRNVHFPKDEKSLSDALRRLAFDEMFTFGIGISLNSHYKTRSLGIPFSPCSLTPFLELLPYELTGAQKRAANDIYKDTVIKDERGTVSPMARILVGDVGSGKTVCAAIALYICAKSGYQAALMAPTEILARQHFGEISDYFSKVGIKCELLLGGTSAKEKKRIYTSLASGDTDVVIGTHALISENVAFNNLALVVTDEQHRFGVAQRAALQSKGRAVHLLVMSATPIPRSLALAMYGDLDISKIDEMPRGRMRVDTFVVDDGYRARLNDFIEKRVADGGQCYVVCPSIEAESEDGAVHLEPKSINNLFDKGEEELKNAVEYTENLKKALPTLRIECLHGRMKSSEKDDIMGRFSEGKIDVLVSTTVIEVGINVPNASLMVVENAERFGLSQLHQLRGRVGRGKRKSYCVLVSNKKTEKAQARLNTMKTTYDGYEIAEKDLQMRGPGDFFSSNSGDSLRQSGGFDFKFAKLCDDAELANSAFCAAKSITAKDPKLDLPEHRELKRHIAEAISSSINTIS